MGDMADYLLDSMFEQALDDPWEEFATPIRAAADGKPAFFKEPPTGPGVCPKCGGGTVLRKGKHGMFYGCLSFPGCKGSRNL